MPCSSAVGGVPSSFVRGGSHCDQPGGGASYSSTTGAPYIAPAGGGQGQGPPNNPSRGGTSSSRPPLVNDVDSWIDELNPATCNRSINLTSEGISAGALLAYLAQQHLPKPQLPYFDGSPLQWVEFIVKFRDMVHRQLYLSDVQKSQLLLQHLRGDAKRAVKGYANDVSGYVLSLKTLKQLFGQRAAIAHAVISQVTKGKIVQNDDKNGLSELYYNVNDCLVTLKQLNYHSDLYSSETLRQAACRLPLYLTTKWAEHCLSIRRRGEEPNLHHLGSWLQIRVMALKEAFLSGRSKPKPEEKVKDKVKEEKYTMLGLTTSDKLQNNSSEPKPSHPPTEPPPCLLCKGKHYFWKCSQYRRLKPEKKFEFVKSLKRCFNCLKDDHMSSKCDSDNKCPIQGCAKKHHASLHKYFSELVSKESKPEEKASEDAQIVGLMQASPRRVYLQIVQVRLHGKNGRHYDTYAVLDTCSESTMMRDDVASKLGLQRKPAKVKIGTVLAKDNAEQMSTEVVTVGVSSRDGTYEIEVKEVYLCPSSRFNMPSRPKLSNDHDPEMFTHLDGVPLEAVAADEVSILIGADVPEAVLHKSWRCGNAGQPLAVETVFGWTLFGPSFSKTNSVHCSLTMTSSADKNLSLPSLWDEHERPPTVLVNLVMTPADEFLHKSVERFWEHEHCGILPPRDVAMSAQDEDAENTLEANTKLVNGHYEVPMLWNEEISSLPNNYPVARKRFNFLERRLKANPELCEKFKGVIDGYLAADPPFARKMSQEEADTVSNRTWYLPMHPVKNPHKPGKVRVVNDAAATFEGVSLNKALITGPDLLNSLVGALLRLRTGKIAIAADVEAMFHQVRVNMADADSLRFLWKDNIHKEGPPDVYQMLVHVFGAKDSPTCANYAIKRIARDNVSSFDGLTIETALKSFYVDDLLKSVPTVECAISLSKDLIALLKRGGMRLTKFQSNCREVLEALPESERAPSATVDIDLGEEKVERALGVSWETMKDVFTFTMMTVEVKFTKRGILIVTSTLFDPLGILAPFVLKAKILLQELWREGLDWDEEISDEHKQYWEKWIAGAKKVSSIQLSRRYLADERQWCEIQLHIFCDASEVAYGSVAYLRFTLKDGNHVSSFVMSKSRLAPIKTITLPRLELNAAVIGARLSRMLIHELDLPIERVQYWSDSTLVLQYIKNKSQRVKVYVANRVTDIREASSPDDWSHMPGEDNPADILSRGCLNPEKLIKSNWFTAPAFLAKDEEHWPRLVLSELDSEDSEVRRKSVLFAMCVLDEPSGIDLKRFSSWIRLKRVVAWIFRFVSNCGGPKGEKVLCQTISVDELDAAETHIVKEVQQEAFKDEMRTIKDREQLLHTNRLSPLSPFIDASGILRVGGRLKDIKIPYHAKHQPILPKQHQVTRILIDWFHRRNGHVGPDHVLSLVREHYWVLNGLTVCKSVLGRCFFCRVRRAMKQFPFMADLPVARAAFGEPPFANCGADAIGPVVIKQGRKRLKRWVVLFTCLTIRCVHLEVVDTCETDSFINALRRFTNRRGCPATMYSDNGTNFKGASKELKEFVRSLDHDAIVDFATTMRIKWHFNPPGAPHMGGVWERLVRSVKEVMTGLVKDHVLTDPQLYTFLTEAENIINSRPLTHISSDVNDMEALTPNHVLLGMHHNWGAIAGTDEHDITSRKHWRQVQGLRAMFWSRWTKEYLPTLTKRACWREKLSNLRVGELVLLQEDNLKKGKWPIARILKVMPGNDGTVRVAEVRTKTGVYTRPATKIIRLEEDIDIRQGGQDVAAKPQTA